MVYFQLALVVLLLLSAVMGAFLTYQPTSVSSQFAQLIVLLEVTKKLLSHLW
jgi:hypothetical protein